MFYLGGVGLAFFLNLLLLSKSRKTLADKILACWLFIITLHLLLFYFRKAELYPQLLASDFPLPLVHGPLLYLYTLALTNRLRSLKTFLLHFLPAVAVLVYIIPFFALPVEQKVSVFNNQGAGYEMFNLIRISAINISGVAYVILSSITLKKHRSYIKYQFSSTEKINLDWLQYLVYWIAAIWILVIIGNDVYIFIATVLFIIFIGFFGIRQVGIFHSPAPASGDIEEPGIVIKEKINDGPEVTVSESSVEKRKYQKSGLNADSSENLHRHLEAVMNNEKIFRESELSLTDLALRLNTQPNYLSQVINEREGKNFYDYINTLRIEEFKRIASSPESRKYTLLALAQECGFNSKSSFNRYCKKVTGKSPSEFMQTQDITEN
jgi:AraC-like DNA-binding protein